MTYLEKLRNSLSRHAVNDIDSLSKSLSDTYCRVANVEPVYTENEAGFFSGSTYKTCFITDVVSAEKNNRFRFHFTVFGKDVDDNKSFCAPVEYQKKNNDTYIVWVPGFPERVSHLDSKDDELINDIIEYAANNIDRVNE